MKKQEILNIAKELIIISAKYKKITNKIEKEKVLKIFDKQEKLLKKDETKYSETILSFLLDLKSDLESGRELNIDKLSTDEYLENYLLTKNELKFYNSLVLQESYRIIFDEINKVNNQDKKVIDIELEKIIKNFNSVSRRINLKLISQNLLIFTVFDRKIPKKYLLNLYKYLGDDKQKQEILKLIKVGNNSLNQVKQFGIEFYKKGNFNYKYLGFSNINGKTVLSEKIVDCSKINERIGNPKYEYKKLIKSL